MDPTRALTLVSDDELLRRLTELLRQSRGTEADLVAHIGEVDARRLYAREASPSMFAWCTDRLHLSEAEAYLRIAAARASREHPMLLTMLADGRLHLTAIAKLAPHLTPENRHGLLERAAHKTKREVEELIAEVAPRPDAPAMMRKLPQRAPGLGLDGVVPSNATGRPGQLAVTGGELRLDAVTPSHHRPGPGTVPPTKAERRPAGSVATKDRLGPDGSALPGAELRLDGVAEAEGPSPSRVVVPATPATIQALAPSRYKVQFTASTELRDKLVRLQALMRSSVRDGDLAAVVEAAVTEKLERLEARRFARTKSPRKGLAKAQVKPSSRHIPAAVRRAVHERDGNRCRFVDEQGRRCTARDGLEYHHRHPFGLGGDNSADGISLLCRTHNQHLAEVDFGRRAMASHRRSKRSTTGPPGLQSQA